MDIPKLFLLLCCAYYGFASHNEGHVIPVENYETELHNLGEHVEIPETPVRVIKITKTVAVKVPVPYPVKVIQKVPYPVHISKPYPVPVPQIVKVPHVESPKPLTAHEALGSNDDLLHQYGGPGNYKVQENNVQDGQSNGGYEPDYQSYEGHGHQTQHFAPHSDDSSEGSVNSYEGPSQNYYGSAAAGSNDGGSFESNSYDDAIKKYIQNANAGLNTGHSLQNYNSYH